MPVPVLREKRASRRVAMQSAAHVTQAVRRRNFFTGVGLVGFVGGVYLWTTTKMKNVSRAASPPRHTRGPSQKKRLAFLAKRVANGLSRHSLPPTD